jgi:V/A-type H+/Na+-transporting ATPase subunit A
MSDKTVGKIVRVSGPLVVAVDLPGTQMHEVVRVGADRLYGEVIEMRSGELSIQVYEETEGLGPGDPVERTGMPLTVELGPGMIGTIFDGIQRPLERIMAESGHFIQRGIDVPQLDREKSWHFVPDVQPGAQVVGGDIIGHVDETQAIIHKIMIPPKLKGTIKSIEEKDATIVDTVAVLQTDEGDVELQMLQRWPVRESRLVADRIPPSEPLVTGQRVLDTLFPIAKGGTACVPGPFGSGKTVVQHQLAKWANADLIVYVGCGERGNEMTDVLLEFPELIDPNTGRPLFERTVLVANTSNMPVAAREASVFTGITMAEYFRDMGYNVAVMADSTSRWAEAIREISGRLEEMPGEEGYPAYLGSRIAAFYERAGNVVCLGSDGRKGSVSLIGAVSPPGGDLSEPVVQATLRVVRVFWGLDEKLASQRHFPAINWLTSYSLYRGEIDKHVNKTIGPDWQKNRTEASGLLQRESELEEIVRLVGMEALSETDRLTMQTAKMIREDFLHQNAFMDIDTYTSLEKQFKMLDAIIHYHHHAREALAAGAEIDELTQLDVLDRVARSKLIPEKDLAQFDSILTDIDEQTAALVPDADARHGDSQRLGFSLTDNAVAAPTLSNHQVEELEAREAQEYADKNKKSDEDAKDSPS